MGATDTIANWIVNTTYEDIPPEAIRVANESCFDVIGVILAGSAQPAGEIIKKYVADQGAAPQATVLSTGEQSSVANAAFANGTMGHALDFDDFGGRSSHRRYLPRPAGHRRTLRSHGPGPFGSLRGRM